MSRKRPSLTPLTVSHAPLDASLNKSFSLSDTGTFAQENFAVGAHGITQSPFYAGEVSTLRLDDLEAGALIGRGASSRVYSAVHRPSGAPLVLKVLQTDIEHNRDSRHMVLNEIKTVFGAGSNQLVTFYDAFFHDGSIYLALEHMDCGSLEGLLRLAATSTVRRLPESVSAAILHQTLQGLEYLHREKRAVHRDLKPANVLLNSTGFVKLSDFGITKELGTGTYAQAGTQVGTLGYMSPERVRGEPYDYSSDIWSFGLIALEAAIGYYPYAGARTVFDIGRMICDGPLPTERPEVQQALSPELLELVQACLCREPQRRPNAAGLMNFPFFRRHLAAPVDLAGYMRELMPRLQQLAMGPAGSATPRAASAGASTASTASTATPMSATPIGGVARSGGFGGGFGGSCSHAPPPGGLLSVGAGPPMPSPQYPQPAAFSSSASSGLASSGYSCESFEEEEGGAEEIYDGCDSGYDGGDGGPSLEVEEEGMDYDSLMVAREMRASLQRYAQGPWGAAAAQQPMQPSSAETG